jgi:carbohydrate kinase (thermoresistant glucokinase family)
MHAPTTLAPARLPIIVMGVSASGKSTFGAALARAMGMDFVDGDDLQPAANIDKMRHGQPLTDEDREPWLRAIGAVLAEGASHPAGVVVACSSLKRSYRDALRAAHPLQFVFLDADRSLIERRFEARADHFMPHALIASQFEALERPDEAETDILTLDAAWPVDAAVRTAVDVFGNNSSRSDTQEGLILRSWHTNAAPWAIAIREERIASRTLVTNRAIVNTVLALGVHRVLDIGCGEGWLARALSREGLAAVGVDAVHSLIAEARGLGGGVFETRSYADLADGRFEHRDFDAAICNFSLLGEESVETLCRAVHRYLAPPAYLIIQTLHPVASCGDHPYRDGWRPGSWSGFGPEFGDPAPWYFRTLNSWLTLLRRCGYQLIDCREPTAPGAALPASIIFVGRVHSPNSSIA